MWGDWQFACSCQAEPTAKRRSHLPSFVVQITPPTDLNMVIFIFKKRRGFVSRVKASIADVSVDGQRYEQRLFYFLVTFQFLKFQPDITKLTPTSLDTCLETLPVRTNTCTMAFSKSQKRYFPQPGIQRPITHPT